VDLDSRNKMKFWVRKVVVLLLVSPVFYYKSVVLDDGGFSLFLVYLTLVICSLIYGPLVKNYSPSVHFIAFLPFVFLTGIILFKYEFCGETNIEKWPYLCGERTSGMASIVLIFHLLIYGGIMIFRKRRREIENGKLSSGDVKKEK